MTRSTSWCARSARWAKARGTSCRGHPDAAFREPALPECRTAANCLGAGNHLECGDGLVQEGAEADRAVARQGEPRAGGPVGEMPVLRPGDLQQGVPVDAPGLPEVRASL